MNNKFKILFLTIAILILVGFIVVQIAENKKIEKQEQEIKQSIAQRNFWVYTLCNQYNGEVINYGDHNLCKLENKIYTSTLTFNGYVLMEVN